MNNSQKIIFKSEVIIIIIIIVLLPIIMIIWNTEYGNKEKTIKMIRKFSERGSDRKEQKTQELIPTSTANHGCVQIGTSLY